jgi:AGCS family alanine or glycine:cation symporter
MLHFFKITKISKSQEAHCKMPSLQRQESFSLLKVYIMMDRFFHVIYQINEAYWMYVGWVILVGAGLYLTFKSRFHQLRVIANFVPTLRAIGAASKDKVTGVSPFRLFFASVGGTIGIGNIAAVTTAILVGGPGAFLWLWLAAFSGMIIKYVDIYLSIQYRKPNRHRSYDGGPMYFVPQAFPGKLGIILAHISAFFLCVYGIEVYQFTVIIDTFESVFVSINREILILGMLVFTVYIVLGGVRRLANFSALLMPVFLLGYAGMCLWIIGANWAALPGLLITVVKSAFTGHAAVGGFAGSTLLMVAQQGAAQGVYSGDTAIGFDAVVQSESTVSDPRYQATMGIISTFTDALVCTLTMLTVLLTQLWQLDAVMKPSEYIRMALARYFGHTDYIFLMVIFLAGFTTIQGYFVVGTKAAQFIWPRYGKWAYIAYSLTAFWFFAHYHQSNILLLMNLSSGVLILINLSAILILSRNLDFKTHKIT